MGDTIPTALALIDDRLDALHALMTDEPIEFVTGGYLGWKDATRTALEGLVAESLLVRFDQARGHEGEAEGRRPTPAVFLDAAASRNVLTVIKREMEATHPQGSLLRIVGLLERRLGRAFRGRPKTGHDLRDGFETLLAGAGIEYQREGDSMVGSSGACVPDFTFPGLQTALKLKLCDRPDRERKIMAELDQEIPAYRAKYPQVVFGVYDLGFIQEPKRFSRAFEAHEGVWVRVIKS